MQQLLSGMRGGGGGGGSSPEEEKKADTCEQVVVSAMALLKMLKHGRAGVPMEVMGLLLGEFVDDLTVNISDCFSMPQQGNSVSVESVDPVFQMDMIEQLRQTGRSENVVGWYHSHPGFGCWFSGTDVSTQQSFEQLHPRAVGIVVDPIQSVKGKVVMDCFRLINPQMAMQGIEPRQTTGNTGHLTRPSLTAQVHGLNRAYYSIVISCRKTQLEQEMLERMHDSSWRDGWKLEDFERVEEENVDAFTRMADLVGKYGAAIKREIAMSEGEIVVKNTGHVDARKRLQVETEQIMERNVLQSAGTLLSSAVF